MTPPTVPPSGGDLARTDDGDRPPGARWGKETELARHNFRISGEPFHPSVITWLAAIKADAARVNRELGLLPAELADAIAAAAEEIVAGGHRDQFPLDVFQTGSGTSTNMNANEVIADLTGGRAHPNDHVNLGQSSNDVMPTAVQLAAAERLGSGLIPALEGLARTLAARAREFADVVKPGRTHLMDAVPTTLGAELAAYAEQAAEALEFLRAALLPLSRVPLGGTAVGTGLGADPRFADAVVARLGGRGRLPVPVSAPHPRAARMGGHDALVAASAALGVVSSALSKIADDLRWMSSGPTGGLGEICSSRSSRRARRSCRARSTRSSPRWCSRSASRWWGTTSQW